jgi:hypothetical protein
MKNGHLEILATLGTQLRQDTGRRQTKQGAMKNGHLEILATLGTQLRQDTGRRQTKHNTQN